MEKEKTVKTSRGAMLLKINNAANERAKFQNMLFANLQVLKECNHRLYIAKKAYNYFRAVRAKCNQNIGDVNTIIKLKEEIVKQLSHLKTVERNRKILLYRFKNAQRKESKAFRRLRKFDVKNFR